MKYCGNITGICLIKISTLHKYNTQNKKSQINIARVKKKLPSFHLSNSDHFSTETCRKKNMTYVRKSILVNERPS